ncbi:MAG: T9SS type A sorting domain-containing protein [Chlorobi bacterium]|nr:T9SS type A sorting domain-containing protein [Chlorobiota bacterium]
MFRKFKYISILFLIASATFAQSVDVGAAEIIAENWISLNENYFGNTKIDETFGIDSNEKSGETIAYFVALYPKGFILVSSDKRMNPVFGFSNEKKIDFSKTENDFFFNIIKDDIEMRIYALKSGKYNRKAADKNRDEWEKLLEGNVDKSAKEIIGPFVESDWGQGKVNGALLFNIYTPNNWPAGCVATSIAQILNYYKWPLRGSGSHSYYDDNTGTQSADFENTIYDWENTLDKYVDVSASQDEKNAAALLTYHACVSVDMDFDFSGSTAETADAPNAFKKYFRTSGEYFSVNATGFFDMLKDDMAHFRPAILSIKAANGAGHAAVVDGYFDTNEYFHLNPGWYGDFSAWYDISDSWNMSGYTIVVGATRNILPVPMFLESKKIDSLSIKISWTTSRKKETEKFELQESGDYGGSWETLSNNLTDTNYVARKNNFGTYYFRIRAMIDGVWGEYSLPEKIAFGYNPIVRFQINMTRYAEPFDSVGLRGNLPPLSGNENSAAFVDFDGDGIYSYEMEFANSDVGKNILYRYSIAKDGFFTIESSNREYLLNSDSLQILPPVYFDDFTSDIREEDVPKEFILKQNFPNPFNSFTTIEFTLPLDSKVSLVLFTSLGKKITELISNEQRASGAYKINLNFENYNLSSGVYYLRLKTLKNSNTIKMIYLK